MPRVPSRFARIQRGFDDHPGFSLVKNPQNGGPGEISGLTMPTKAKGSTVEHYLQALDPDRRAAVQQLRATIKQHLPPGFEEQMQWGMVSYVVPHARYPAGYHGNPQEPLPFLALASQKAHIGVYHMGLYASPELMAWFIAGHAQVSAKKLDAGKSCIRYKKPADIPYGLIGELAGRLTVAQWVALYEAQLLPPGKKAR
jgi:hypothetical protein